MWTEPTPSASGAQAFRAHERGTQTGTQEPTRPKRLTAADAWRASHERGAEERAAHRLEAEAKLDELRERRADPKHPRGHVRSVTAAVRYFLTDCPWHGFARKEIADRLGCCPRSINYATAALRSDGDYVERAHVLANDPDLRGQLPLERAILRLVPAEGSDLHGGVQALSDPVAASGHPDLSPSSVETDHRAKDPAPNPGDLSASAFARAMLDHAQQFERGSRVKPRERVADVRPVPAVMATPARATRASLNPDPVELPADVLDALAGRVDAAVFDLVTSGLRHPSCYVDPALTAEVVRVFTGLDDRELASVRKPGGWIVDVTERGLRGEDLIDRRVRGAERAAIMRNPDLSESWEQFAQLIGVDAALEPAWTPRTPKEWALAAYADEAERREGLAARRQRVFDDAERERADRDLEARVAARERARLGADGGTNEPDTS